HPADRQFPRRHRCALSVSRAELMRPLRCWAIVGAALSSLGVAQAQDISNPLHLMFVADVASPLLDVVDLEDRRVVYRIDTEHVVDDLVVTPNAPILAYSNIERRTLTFYDLRSKAIARTTAVPLAPRHMVLDTTGGKIAITDSER